MRGILEKIKLLHVFYVLAVVLFLSSLFLPPMREAHVLCARLLLHLRGDTFVQGNPPGCIIYIIPNVQFTERHVQELRSRSTNSLDDFALASATGGYLDPESPLASESWSKHPLLEWAAFRLAWLSCEQYSKLNPTNMPATNVVALAAIQNALQAIQIAQKADPTNGALWLAEASIDFAQKQDAAALAALQMAATNRNWNANTAATFPYIAELLQKAGLSELDAASEANGQTPSMSLLVIQGKCLRSVDELIFAAVKVKSEQQFSTLLKLLVELRRAQRSDYGEFARNLFRKYQGQDEMINEMAKQMGLNPLPKSENVSYEENQQKRDRIFDNYLNRYADPKTATSFVTQSEDYQTEKRLLAANSELQYRSVMWNWMLSSISGPLSILTLSLLVIAILFEIVLFSLQKFSGQIGRLPRQKEFWVIASTVLIASVAVFANFIFASGANNDVGFRMAEPPPLISPNLQALLLSLLLCSAWMVALLLAWKVSKTPLRHWWVTLFFAYAYLALVVAMAWFRFETAQAIAAGFY